MKTFAAACIALCLSVSAQAQAPPEIIPAAGPSLEEALDALMAANQAAEEMDVALSCAVVDSAGDVVASTRMDGARPLTGAVASGKALMSSMFGAPSGGMAQMADSPFFASLNASVGNRLFPIQGALPIVRDNKIYGAMGCSGATGQQDEDAARAGIEAM